MTIKQNGGVFGRNPTFNDVKVEGDLTVDGAVVHTGDLTIDNINISGNTISSTNTNGNILLDPNGTGYSLIAAPTNGTIAQYGDTGSRTFFLKQANVGGYDNDTLIHESDSGVGQFQWKNSSNTLATLASGGNLTLAVGNLVVASGSGIDFSATSGTGTSELFDDYEEGSWTPVVADAASGGNTSASSFTGDYTKVGNLVFVNCSLVDIDTTGLTAGNDLYIQGLPFTPKSGTLFAGSVFGRVTISGTWCTAAISTSAAIRLEDNPGTTANPSRVPVSGIVDDGGDLRISITYIEA